jgi:hypothetical protein
MQRLTTTEPFALEISLLAEDANILSLLDPRQEDYFLLRRRDVGVQMELTLGSDASSENFINISRRNILQYARFKGVKHC